MPALPDLSPEALALIETAVFSPPRGRAGILRPRPAYLPHPCCRLPQLRRVVQVRVENGLLLADVKTNSAS